MAISLPNILKSRIIKGIAAAITLIGCSFNASAQQDSIIIPQPETIIQPSLDRNENLTKVYWSPNPNKAMWYSVLCPGLGQIYNRSYWKVPVIYGGAAVFGYLITWQGRMYNDYSNAWKKNTLRKKRDSYRRYRDLCIFGVGLLYVLNVVDAFVDGHLYDFSVTNDLSFHVDPFIQPGYDNFGTSNASYGLQCSFTF